MQDNLLIFDLPGWFITIAFTLALLVALAFYYKKEYPWSMPLSYFLGVLRFLGVFLILVLIMNPLLKQVVRQTEKPGIVFAIDNSESIVNRSDSSSLFRFNNDLIQTYSELRNMNHEVEVYQLDGKSKDDQIIYNAQKTDITRILSKISEDYDGRNLGSIVLISDGIFNSGISPAYWNTTTPVITIGMGDTIPPRDISIVEVLTNKIAYQGNQFPVKVRIAQSGFDDTSLRINVKQGGDLIASLSIEPQSITEVDFLLDADLPGLRRYVVEVPPKEGESSIENNVFDFYIDIIEGKEKVLLISSYPHPDIKALRSSLSKSQNYETEVYIPGISELPDGQFDVIIQFDAFGPKSTKYNGGGDPSYWYFLGERFDVSLLSQNTGIDISVVKNQKDNVIPSYNKLFSSFQLNEELIRAFQDYPPLTVPYGQYVLSGPVKTLLYQKIGSIITTRPLLAVFDDGSTKSALLMSTGIWKWRLLESAMTGSSENFDDMVLKLVQYLSIKSDKRKFRLNPEQNVFNEGEEVRFVAEVYNNIYEQVYGNNIRIILTDENEVSQSYDFINSEGNVKLKLGRQKPGIYKYYAETLVGNEKQSVTGEFLVKEIQLEKIRLTADHHLLRNISNKSGGQFYLPDELDQVVSEIQSRSLKGRIKSSESYFPLIHNYWIFGSILLIFSIEWFLRKYYGGY